MKSFHFLPMFLILGNFIYGQNVGIGLAIPTGKLHLKGSANIPQLIIDAYSAQSDSVPLIKMRNSGGTEVMRIHADGSNSFIGQYSGKATTDGGDNTFVGALAGASNTIGSDNTAVGYEALASGTIAAGNTAVGMSALASNYGGQNTAVGANALYSGGVANYNIGIGSAALFSNSYASQNIAIGINALYRQSYGGNTWTSDNTAIGFEALYNNNPTATTNGIDNTAVGNYAMHANTTGYYNTACGLSSLSSNTEGTQNTAVGFYSLFNTTNSWGNTAIGYYAGGTLDNGYYNCFIGSETDVNGIGYYNCIALGHGTVATAPSQARFGNSATNSIGGYADWTNISDGRYKKDVKEDVKGIDFIMKLRPVTYHLDITGINQKLNENRSSKNEVLMDKAIADKEKIVQTGFVAQDVEKAAIETGYDFSGVDKPANEKSFYGLRYAEFVVPLVKAIQEQQAIIGEQNKMIKALQKENEKFKSIEADITLLKTTLLKNK